MNKEKFNFNKKTILITGGAGFIGSNLAFYIQNKFPQAKIVIFDCFRSEEKFSNGNLKSFGHYNNLIGFNGEVICGNINNRNDLKILDNYHFDVIFHQAAISDTRVYDQEEVIKTNLNSFYFFLEKTIQDNAKLIYASSAATYGSAKSPQSIGDEYPENPYGYSKYAMDNLAREYVSKNKNISIFGLRYFNVYGPNEFYKDKTASTVIQFGHQILGGKNPKLFHNSDKIFRDFIYIDDVINANILACSSSRSGVYNVGTSTPRSFLDIVNILQELLGTSLDVDYIPNPYSGYQNYTCADISDSVKFLNFTPKFSLEEGIKSYIPEIKKIFLEFS